MQIRTRPTMKKPAIVLGLLLALITIPLAMALLRPAIHRNRPQIDDSDIDMPTIHVKDSENGFAYLVQSIPDDVDLGNDLLRININRQLTSTQTEDYQTKYGGYLKAISKAAGYELFFSPIISKRNDVYRDKNLSIENTGLLLKIDIMLIWQDFRNGRNDDAIEKIDVWLRLAKCLQNSYGGFFTYSTGSEIQHWLFREINALADADLLTDEDMKNISSILHEHGDFSSGMTRVVKSSYHQAKLEVRNLCRTTGVTIIYRFLCRVSFDENQTLKIFHADLVRYLPAAGQPYNDFPLLSAQHFADQQSRLDMPKAILNGNGMGFYLYRESENELLLSINFSQTANNEVLSNALRVRLALLQYYDRNHMLPASLDALVPDYLPAIPRDPVDGKHLRYNPQKKIVYSVGHNLRDDGGIASKEIFDSYLFMGNTQDMTLPIMKKSSPSKQSFFFQHYLNPSPIPNESIRFSGPLD